MSEPKVSYGASLRILILGILLGWLIVGAVVWGFSLLAR